ncbi:DUF488 family protein [Methanococcoides burtonii]|uniref:DUF488 domain-containing protein n=1 Tax=Methanococcoides burtonii (strain DSM 6242 / NBRC 107633 / OCM 468 / ACE-M) TaxID=259564 RepID=Q12WU1_METBU|nr:DUF488 family protein [Methanococcoides burtonii]ABE52085.1 Protein of unknown function DUF1130 [Methanococcoides burtonii DSM 6242]
MITHKQRALLSVIDRLNERGNATKFMIVKNLFLLSVEENIGKVIKFYHFFPYHYGPFSNAYYADITKLQSDGLIIENDHHLELTEKGKDVSTKTERKAIFRIRRVANKFSSDKQIREYVYEKYPEFTVKSKLVDNKEKQLIPGLFSIGYEGRDIDQFLNLLIQNNINILADVRKNPFSMKFSFTKKKLSTYLEKIGIQYIHIPDLGIESDDRKELNSMTDYQNLFKEYADSTLKRNKEHLDYIYELSQSNRVAMMCFEADIDMCHRGVIAKSIANSKGIEVVDI